mmetsp:Transcript_38713/g.106640  ORF Transcript_38713/g.106640 Transcript_38713/m.106640 type:complete len:346 (-) Transcript_38713:182-1219(-)
MCQVHREDVAIRSIDYNLVSLVGHVHDRGLDKVDAKGVGLSQERKERNNVDEHFSGNVEARDVLAQVYDCLREVPDLEVPPIVLRRKLRIRHVNKELEGRLRRLRILRVGLENGNVRTGRLDGARSGVRKAGVGIAEGADESEHGRGCDRELRAAFYCLVAHQSELAPVKWLKRRSVGRGDRYELDLLEDEAWNVLLLMQDDAVHQRFEAPDVGIAFWLVGLRRVHDLEVERIIEAILQFPIDRQPDVVLIRKGVVLIKAIGAWREVEVVNLVRKRFLRACAVFVVLPVEDTGVGSTIGGGLVALWHPDPHLAALGRFERALEHEPSGGGVPARWRKHVGGDCGC